MFAHISSSVCAPSFGQRRQILDAGVIERSESRAGASGLFVITFDDAVRVEIVFHHGKPRTAGRANRLADLLDLLIASGLAIDRLRKTSDHHIAERQVSGFEFIHASANVLLLPWDGRAAHDDVTHSQLLHTAKASVIEMGSGHIPHRPHAWRSRDRT